MQRSCKSIAVILANLHELHDGVLTANKDFLLLAEDPAGAT